MQLLYTTKKAIFRFAKMGYFGVVKYSLSRQGRTA